MNGLRSLAVSASLQPEFIGGNCPITERFNDRLRRDGVRAELAAENIGYGPPTPSDVVRELIIDSGVPGRGHRRNTFHPAMAAAGVNCGPHREYTTMCVIDFASAPIQAEGWRQAELRPKGHMGGGSFFRLLLARRGGPSARRPPARLSSITLPAAS